MKTDDRALNLVGLLAGGCLLLAFLAMMIDRTSVGIQVAGVFITVTSNVVTGILAYMRGHSNGVNETIDKVPDIKVS